LQRVTPDVRAPKHFVVVSFFGTRQTRDFSRSLS
jgi:hypothetical protein